MIKQILIVALGLIIGVFVGYFFKHNPASLQTPQLSFSSIQKKQVVGFLPYWLLDKAKTDYSKYVNTLTYFGLTLDTDGKILKLSNEQETEPGWLALNSGKLNTFLDSAKEKKVFLSLLVFAGDEESINTLIMDPVKNAQNLVEDLAPIMRKHGFSDLNLDIEKTGLATDEQRSHFTQFATEVKSGLDREKLGTLTIDISPTAFIKSYLIDPVDIAKIADHLVVMAYDFHFAGSYVTGPIAPINGTETNSEFDTQVAIQQAIKVVPANKVILGIPLYGYEWETINDFPRAAIIPSSGQTISNSRAEQFLNDCGSCTVQTDSDAREKYLIYKDENTDTFHEYFFPDADSTQTKIDFVKANNLGGVALWALGYEGNRILDPLLKYK